VTLLRPEEQLTKLGSIGRECLGTGRIKVFDSEGNEIVDGEVGELYSRTPYAFQGYWKCRARSVFKINFELGLGLMHGFYFTAWRFILS
jgi:non-ribosomal peptide synthetase component E (peptide arylation enzyme)